MTEVAERPLAALDQPTPPSCDGIDLEPLGGRWRTVAIVAAVAVIAIGVALRLWTRSALWLDEALTVNIAGLPVREIPSYLRRDGAPPLYYLLLHYWLAAFGNSDLAARSMSAVLSVATLPFAWAAGRRIGGRPVAWATLLLLASAPFAVYYATEARMYSLVMFFTAAGFVAVCRVLDRPRVGNVAAVLAVCAGGLLYSQYWGLYLVGATAVWLCWRAWHEPGEGRRASAWALGALAIGILCFVPWVPTFLYQTSHTGTPWATPPNYAAMINAVTGFGDNQGTASTAGTNQGRLLALGYFVLVAFALFGLARDRRHIDMDIRTRPAMRPLGFIILATLVAAITGAILSGSAFSSRYAAVVFVPILLLAAYGLRCLAAARVRAVVLAVLVVAGLAGSVENIWTQRTQAPEVVAALDARAHAGDLVVFCPDQLGPAVYRYFATGQDTARGPYGQFGRYQMITYPRGIGPKFVDWVTYVRVARGSDPEAFAQHLVDLAGSDHEIWLVSAPNYTGFANKCGQLAGSLAATTGYGAHNWVYTKAQHYYEPMSLTEFKPPGYSAPATP